MSRFRQQSWALIAAPPELFAAATPVGGPLGNTKIESLPKNPIWLHFGELDCAEEIRGTAKQLQATNPAFKATDRGIAVHSPSPSAPSSQPAKSSA